MTDGAACEALLENTWSEYLEKEAAGQISADGEDLTKQAVSEPEAPAAEAVPVVATQEAAPVQQPAQAPEAEQQETSQDDAQE